MTLTTTSLPAQAFIDGEFVDARSGETFDTYAPATGEVLTSIAACGPEDVDDAVRSARTAFEHGTWRGMAPAERKTILLRLAELIDANAAEIARLDAIDAGKPITDCEEIDAGNSVIVKPAEQAPLSTLRIAELAAEAGVPDGAFNVVPGLGHVAGRALGLHGGVDVVTFTGSTEVGREFLRYSADSNLKRIVLECGGKSPQIVMADAARNLEYVADQLANAAFWNMGENCTCGSRIIVDASIRDDVVQALAGATASWTVGDPLDRSTRLGPLIEPSALERVLGYIEQAEATGDMASLRPSSRTTSTGRTAWRARSVPAPSP